MANNLLNGPEASAGSSPAAPSATVPTWGYNRKGEARIFELAPGANLPKGWHDTPQVKAGDGSIDADSE